MSKKIDAALKDLKKALEAHADVVGGSAVSLKKAQRASAKVSEAATAYADAVHSKSGLASPFGNLMTPGLEESTLASLTAERDSLKQHLTGPVPMHEPAQAEAAASESHDAEEHHAAQVEPGEEDADEDDSEDDSHVEHGHDDGNSNDGHSHENHDGHNHDGHNHEDHQHPHS